jgi:hypothetical protein
MRLLGRLLALLLLLVSMAWVLMPVIEWVESTWFSDSRGLEDLPEEARPATVFWLQDAEWTRFNLSKGANMIRLLAHVQLPQGQYEETYSPPFAIRFQLLGEQDEVLRDRVYHFETALPSLATLADGRTFPRRFYADSARQATLDQYLFMDVASVGNVEAIRVTPTELPAPDSRIGIRMAKLEMLTPERAARAWQRMNEVQKADRVDGLIVPHYLASGAEILNRVSDRWAPVGPAGIEGETFETDSLYLLDAPPDKPDAPESQRPPGLYADANHAITMPMPESSAALYRLELLPLDLSDDSPAVRATLTYQDNDSLKQRTVSFDPEDIPAVWQQELQPGLLKIEPNQPVVARLFRVGSDTELTPDRMLIPTFQVTSQSTLEYRLNPASARAQPLRLDVRSFDVTTDSRVTSLTATFHNLDGEILECKSIGVMHTPASLQRLAADPTLPALSEPQRIYLSGPASASRLIVETDGSALITLYARPQDKPISRVLPDQLRPWQNSDERVPNWYIAKPEGVDQLIRQKRRYLVEWFYDLIELDAEVAAGNYEWEALKTREPRPQRQFLYAIDEDAPLREEARSSTFGLLPRSGMKIALDSTISGVAFSPNVIFSRPNGAPSRVAFLKNDEPWYERGIAGTTGQFSLPTLSKGEYRISTAAEGRWYINFNEKRGTHRRRLAYDLPVGGLRFEVIKSATEEVVTLQFFAHPSLADTRVKVRILGPVDRSRSTEEYTFLNREYTLKPQENDTLAIGTRQTRWSEPLRVGVPLGADLPPGRYTISVEREQGLPLMVSAYRILEGEKAPYRFFVESQHEE